MAAVTAFNLKEVYMNVEIVWFAVLFKQVFSIIKKISYGSNQYFKNI